MSACTHCGGTGREPAPPPSPRAVPGIPGAEYRDCAACGRRIIWLPTGTMVDPEPSDEGFNNGTETVILSAGRLCSAIRADVIGRFTCYQPHFMTCPEHLIPSVRRA
jgi:hypothetical protein